MSHKTDDFDDEVADRWMGGQPRDSGSDSMGVSGSTFSDHVEKKVIPKYGREYVKNVREASQAMIKANADPKEILANAPIHAAILECGLQNDLGTLKVIAEAVKQESTDPQTVGEAVREFVKIYLTQKAENKNVKLADVSNVIGEQIRKSAALATQIAQQETEIEEGARRKKAIVDYIAANGSKIQECQEIHKTCTDAGLDLHDGPKFRNCLTNLKECRYDSKIVIAKVTTLESITNDCKLEKQKVDHYRSQARELAEKIDDLNDRHERVRQDLRVHERLLDAATLLTVNGVSIGFILDMDQKIKEISIGRGIAYADAAEVFRSSLKDYGPLLGFKRAASQFKEYALQEVRKTTDFKRTNADLADDLREVRDLHNMSYSSQQISVLGMAAKSAGVNFGVLKHELEEFGSLDGAIKHEKDKLTAIQNDNKAEQEKNAALKEDNQRLSNENETLDQRMQSVESKIAAAEQKLQLYSIPPGWLYLSLAARFKATPKIIAMEAAHEMVPYLQQICGSPDEDRAWRQVDVSILAYIDFLKEKERNSLEKKQEQPSPQTPILLRKSDPFKPLLSQLSSLMEYYERTRPK